MSHIKILENIRRARSAQDLARIVTRIQTNLKKHNQVLLNLSRLPSTAASAPKAGTTIKISRRDPTNAIKVTKTRKPGEKVVLNIKRKDAINKHNQVIQSLHENIQELDNIEQFLKHTFPKAANKDAVLRALSKLRDEAVVTIQAANNRIVEEANAHAPEEFKRQSQLLFDYVVKLFPQYKRNITRDVHISQQPDGVHFNTYVIVDKLRDDKGFEYNYCIVLTAVVADEQMHLFLTTLPEYKIPGAFTIGEEVKDFTAIKKRLGELLAHDKFHTTLEPQSLPVAENELAYLGFNRIPYVIKTSMPDKETLRVWLKGQDKAQALTVAVQVRQLLQYTLKTLKKTVTIINSPVKGIDGKMYMDFTTSSVTSGHKQTDKHLTLQRENITALKDILKLQPEQMQKMLTFLRTI